MMFVCTTQEKPPLIQAACFSNTSSYEISQRPSEVCECLPLFCVTPDDGVSVNHEILDISKCINNIHHLKCRDTC